MIFYYLLYFFLSFKSIEEVQAINTFKKGIQNILIIFFSLIIGLRQEVGCDWDQYKAIFESYRDGLYNYALWIRLEPSYYILNSIFSRWEFGYYFINLVCAIIFSYCLIKYCENLPRPWLALCIAYPYFIMVVSMGYTRQSVSIGLALLGFLALEKGQFYKSIFYIFLGTTFHRSGVLFFYAPLIYTFQGSRFNNLIKFILTIPVGYFFIDNFILSQFASYRSGYLDQQLSSQGSLIRIVLCIIPSLIFIFNLRKFNLSKISKKIYLVMALMSFIALLLLAIVSSSAVIDRLALNLIPLQILVSSYIPDMHLLKIGKFPWKVFITIFAFFVLSVWLLFATHSHCWIPYRNVLYQFDKFNF